MTKQRATLTFLVALTAAALYFCYLLVAPFLKSIAFSVILAILCYPLHSRMRRWVPSRNIAALLSTAIITIVVVLVSVLLARALVSGLRDVSQPLLSSSNDREKLSVYIVDFLDRLAGWASVYLPVSALNLRDAISNEAQRVVTQLLSMGAGVLGRFTSFLTSAVISFLYFSSFCAMVEPCCAAH